MLIYFFFFNDPATTEIYTLSYTTLFRSAAASCATRGADRGRPNRRNRRCACDALRRRAAGGRRTRDRKSTRLNSSHGYISYAVFCLKKKKKNKTHTSNQQ